MNHIETLALSKAVNGEAKTARNQLSSGSYDVDFSVRIHGQVRIGQSYDATPTASVPIKRAMAALAYIAGCTGKNGIRIIERAMRIAISTDQSSADALTTMLPKIEAIEQKVIASMLRGLPKIPCKGKVTTSLTVDDVIAEV